MFDDDTARRALQTLTDGPAPLPTTTLGQVLRRGRRRVFVQRAGAVAGVMVVVAAIGAGALLVRQDDPGDSVRVGGTSRAATPEWPDGWALVDTRTADGACMRTEQQPTEGNAQLLSQPVVQQAVLDAIRAVLGTGALMVSANWNLNPPDQDTPRGIIVVDVPMPGGTSMLQLDAGGFGGTPQHAADWWSTSGTCDRPYRRVEADGAVLQLYPASAGPGMPIQQAQVFQPDGRMYFIVTGPRPDRKDQLIDVRQLAAIAIRLATDLR